MEFKIKPHTVIFTVAPSGSGKTTFCKEVLVKQIRSKYPDLNVQYIGSDDLRLELLGLEGTNFDDSRMMEASESAFRLLEMRLESVMKYDIRAEIIIVDTTGLSPIFREYIGRVCNENRYSQLPVVFDYKDYKEYYQTNSSNSVTSAQLRKLRNEVLAKISKSKYPNRIRIQQRLDIDNCVVTVENYEAYKSHILDNDGNYVIVSDIHGCLDEFKELIQLQPDTTIDDNDNIVSDKVFIVQDFIDKGNKVLDTIEFIHKNVKNGRILVLRGNHENFVYKAINGLLPDFEEKWLKGDLRPKLEEHFSTYFMLLDEENSTYRQMFEELIEGGRDFYSHKHFFVNHSPCHPKYLGKMDGKSLSAQRSYSYAKKEKDETDEAYFVRLKAEMDGFLNEYNNRSYRHIIWGHVSMGRVYSTGRNFMIDTGCVMGGKLTSVDFNWKGNAFFKEVKSKQPVTKELPIFHNTSNEVNFKDLDNKSVSRIKYLAKDKVNFIMGTMSPSDKDDTDEVNTLESLKAGLDYFKGKGQNKIMMQNKYMGSNATVYLFRDIEKSYCTSRNGYLIKVDVKDAYVDLHKRMLPYMEANDFDLLLISAELMPFMTLGRGLIDNTFKNTYVGFNSELPVLAKSGFYDQLNDLYNHPRREEFNKEYKSLSRKELNDKYGSRDYNILKKLDELEESIPTLAEELNGNINYKMQLDLFTQEGNPYFLPFTLLKAVKTDGSEVLFFDMNTEENFKLVSDDDYHIVDFSDEDYLAKARAYYHEHCMIMGFEGVVLKPETLHVDGVLPFMKVRNPKYLTLTYGYDYQNSNKFSKLFNRKNIKHKMAASMKQWKIAKAMLETPYNEISLDNKPFIQLAINMVIEEKRAESIDPRL